MIDSAIGAVILVGWLYLLLGRGGFWRADQRLASDAARPADWPSVIAVVPARNEEAVIGRAIASLRAQDYPGRFRIVVVDDQSDDRTADAAQAVEVLRGDARPPDWAGKPWAMAQGAMQAGDADYVWFTDADIAHHTTTLSRLVAKAKAENLDLVSLMVLLDCRTIWDRFLIPAFVFFFQMLYPFRRVNDSQRSEAAAAGGSMLARATALTRIGGIAAIKGELIDDCALAGAIKGSGGRVWLGLSERDISIRPYGGLVAIWNMVARSAFDQLDYSFLALAGTILGLGLIYVAPPVFAAFGSVLGAAAWLLMAAAAAPTLKLYRQPAWLGLFLPVAALLYAGMTIDSARRHWHGRGGEWKGRSHRTVTSSD